MQDKPIDERHHNGHTRPRTHLWRGDEVERATLGRTPEEDAVRAEGKGPVHADAIAAAGRDEDQEAESDEGSAGVRGAADIERDEESDEVEAKREEAAEEHANARPLRDKSL